MSKLTTKIQMQKDARELKISFWVLRGQNQEYETLLIIIKLFVCHSSISLTIQRTKMNPPEKRLDTIYSSYQYQKLIRDDKKSAYKKSNKFKKDVEKYE